MASPRRPTRSLSIASTPTSSARRLGTMRSRSPLPTTRACARPSRRSTGRSPTIAFRSGAGPTRDHLEHARSSARGRALGMAVSARRGGPAARSLIRRRDGWQRGSLGRRIGRDGRARCRSGRTCARGGPRAPGSCLSPRRAMRRSCGELLCVGARRHGCAHAASISSNTSWISSCSGDRARRKARGPSR